MSCKAPKCFRTKQHKCLTPNPWIVFRMTHKGQLAGLSRNEIRQRYQAWLARYFPFTEGEDALVVRRSRLCLSARSGRPPPQAPAVPKTPRPRGGVAAYMAGLRARMLQNGREPPSGDAVPCNPSDNDIKELKNYINVQALDGVGTMDACEKISLLLLQRAFRKKKDEVRKYRFRAYLGGGAYGTVFSMYYGPSARRAVKFVFLHSQSRETQTQTMKEVEHEVRNQAQAVRRLEKLDRIRTADIYDFKVTRTPRGVMAVFVMDEIDMSKLKIVYFGGMIQHVRKYPTHVFELCNTMILTILRMQSIGIIHSDLHPGNIGFPAKPGDPVRVWDWGRAMFLDEMPDLSRRDRTHLKIMDLLSPLGVLATYTSKIDEARLPDAIMFWNEFSKRVNMAIETNFPNYETILEQPVGRVIRELLTKKPSAHRHFEERVRVIQKLFFGHKLETINKSFGELYQRL